MSHLWTITLAIVKPECFCYPHIAYSILHQIVDSGFAVVAARRLQLSTALAKNFYKQHEQRFFYQRLIGHITSGPCLALLLAKRQSPSDDRDAATSWRQFMGATKVYRTVFEQPNTLRGQFGLTDTRNVAHGADPSRDVVEREAGLCFPEFDWVRWNAKPETFSAVPMDDLLRLFPREFSLDSNIL